MSFKARPAAAVSDRALALLRELCGALPGVEETRSWGHPNFRAGRPARIFAALERAHGVERICVKVGPEARDALLAEGEPYAALPYDARGQWIGIDVDQVDPSRLAVLLDLAHRDVGGGAEVRSAPRKPAVRRRRPAG